MVTSLQTDLRIVLIVALHLIITACSNKSAAAPTDTSSESATHWQRAESTSYYRSDPIRTIEYRVSAKHQIETGFWTNTAVTPSLLVRCEQREILGTEYTTYTTSALFDGGTQGFVASESVRLHYDHAEALRQVWN